MGADQIVGVISDTHGLLRPEAVSALRGCDLILHAGDIGPGGIVQQLAQLAPVHGVRGNVDRDEWAQTHPITEVIEIGGRWIYLIHNIAEIDIDPRGGFDAVVFGHSHQPCNEYRDGVLYFNPGSAGPRRFKLPVAVGRLRIGADGVSGEVIKLAL